MLAVMMVCMLGGQSVDAKVWETQGSFMMHNSESSRVQFELQAYALNQLGLFNGVSTEVFTPALDQMANREQAVKLIADVFQWDIDASAKSTFSDVSDWAQPYVAKAVEKGLISGFPDGTFRGQAPITVQQLDSILLRSIGYPQDEAWGNATSLSEVEFNYEYGNGNKELNRDLLVGMLFSALYNGKQQGEKMTLLETMIANDPQLKEKAMSLELITNRFDYDAVTNEAFDMVDLKEMTELFSQTTDVRESVEELLDDLVLRYVEYVSDGYVYRSDDLPTDMDVSAIKYVGYFGEITLVKEDDDFILQSIIVDMPNYFSYGDLQVGEKYTDEIKSTISEVDSWFSQEFFTYIFNDATLDIQGVIIERNQGNVESFELVRDEVINPFDFATYLEDTTTSEDAVENNLDFEAMIDIQGGFFEEDLDIKAWFEAEDGWKYALENAFKEIGEPSEIAYTFAYDSELFNSGAMADETNADYISYSYATDEGEIILEFLYDENRVETLSGIVISRPGIMTIDQVDIGESINEKSVLAEEVADSNGLLMEIYNDYGFMIGLDTTGEKEVIMFMIFAMDK